MTSAVLQTEQVDIAALKHHPDNARMGDVEMLKQSLTEHGQYSPIIASVKTQHVLKGNHTLKAAKELGWPSMLVSWVDVDAAGERKILLIDNKSSDGSSYDDEALNKLLESMMLAGELQGTGWTPDEVDDRLALADALPEVDVESEADYQADAETLAETYKNRNNDGALRQFVLLYPNDTATEVEANVKKLQAEWGVEGMRDVVAEALRRAAGTNTTTEPEAAPAAA